MNNNLRNLTLDLNALFPFELDQFQQEAIAHLDQGKSVVVCAPTGSGKTLIAEYAIYRALARGKRVFYTTPLKALSNQKFRDLSEKFNPETLKIANSGGFIPDTGLITGDIIINPGAAVVVMTTEIFRNMLYQTPIGQVGTSLEDVETVILDECHYISDRDRGTVWEESIIYCPPTIQLVALSATIDKPERLTDWINKVRTVNVNQKQWEKPVSLCELINSDFRPVPLKFYFSSKQGLFPLLNNSQNKINPQFLANKSGGKRKRLRREDCPAIVEIVEQLYQKEMLPAIYIIFSRRGCEQAVRNLGSLNLLNPEESKNLSYRLLSYFLISHSNAPEMQENLLTFFAETNIQLREKLLGFIANNANAQEELLEYLEENPPIKSQLFQQIGTYSKFIKGEQLEALSQGVASHHAGILPVLKELVEQLFEIGLIKVVFATSTLAAGINMPARTTVISAISKRTDEGHTMLTPSEFMQIAGRAGRRGMDQVGYVVTVQTPFEGPEDAAKLAIATPEELKSCFTPSYGMVLNLLQKHTLDEAKDLLERSFAEYLAQLKLAPKEQVIANLTTKIAKLDIELVGIDEKQVNSYSKLTERIKEERRLLKILQHQAQMFKKREIAPILYNLQIGNILHLKGKHIKVGEPLLALFLVSLPGSGKSPDLLCLGEDNRWYIVAHGDVADINPGFLPLSEMTDLPVPTIEKAHLGPWRKGDEKTYSISEKIVKYALTLPSSNEVTKQQKRLESVQEQIDSHSLHKYKNPGHIVEKFHHRANLKDELHRIQLKYQKDHAQKSYYWDDFLNLIEILQEFNALEGYKPSQLGEACAALRGENELWLGLIFMSGELEYLEPPQLASAVSAIITETLRPDTWSNYICTSEIFEVFQRVGSYGVNLLEMRRQLIQAQHKKIITIPVWFESELMGLVEEWAQGTQWQDIIENVSLDEGDVVRLLRRTVDLLWQVPQVPGISDTLKFKAKKAIAAIRRFPVATTDD